MVERVGEGWGDPGEGVKLVDNVWLMGWVEIRNHLLLEMS